MRNSPSILEPLRRQQIRECLLPAALISFTLFIFGPFAIYFWNPGQLEVGFLSVLIMLLPAAVVATVILLLPAGLLPASLFDLYNPFLIGFGATLWLQGQVIVGSYGLLDGSSIDFDTHSWRVWPELLLWVGVPSVAVVLYRRHRNTIVFVAWLVLTLQVLHLVGGSIAYPGTVSSRTEQPFPVELPVFSSSTNIIQVVLDGFQSDAFAEVLERFPHLTEAFDGFVYFENGMGSFPSTRMSIPALLSGRVYRNEVPMDEFAAEAISDHGLPAVLFEQGFVVDVVTLRRYRYGERYSTWFSVVRPFADEQERLFFTIAEVVDLACSGICRT